MGMYDLLADSLQRIYANEGANQANLAIAKGNALARGQEQSGQIWGQTLGQLGGMVANLPGQIAQQKEAQQRMQITGMQMDAMKQSMAAQQRANQVIANLKKNDDGTIDTMGAVQQFAGAGLRLEDQEHFAKTLDGFNDRIRAANKTKVDHLADVANTLLEHQPAGQPMTADTVHLGCAAMRAVPAFGITDQDEQQFVHLMAQGAEPSAVLKAVRDQGSTYKTQKAKIAEEMNKPMKVGEGEKIINPATKEVLAEGGALRKTEAELAADAANPNSPTAAQSKAAVATLQAPAFQNANRAEAAQVESARHNRAMEVHAKAEEALSRARLNQEGSAAKEDAESVADAIISGDQPATVQGLYRLAGPVRAALARKGFNLTTANLDWEATKKHLSTLNGAQQTRLRQAIGTAGESLGVIEDLAKQWDGGRFPLLNKANLALAKNGAMGPKAQQIATNLVAQITDVTSELGNVYMGGNSPTDHALSLASQNLSADWTKDQLLSAIKLARTNLQIRNNSITNSGAITATSQAAPAAQTPAATAVGTIKTFPNGKKGRWDGTGWEQVK